MNFPNFTYRVFSDQSGNELRLLRKGFHFMPAIFGIFWMLYNRLWFVALCWGVLLFSARFIETYIYFNHVILLHEVAMIERIDTVITIFYLILFFVPGFLANRWLTQRYIKMGLKPVSVIKATNSFSAKKNYSTLIDAA